MPGIMERLSSQIVNLTKRSIEGQTPSYKNFLSRALIGKLEGKKPENNLSKSQGSEIPSSDPIQEQPVVEAKDKPEVGASPEFDLSKTSLNDPSIKNVVAQLATNAEQMMKGSEEEPAIKADEMSITLKVLAQLDAIAAREKETLLDESPLKKLAQMANQMNESNMQLLLSVIDGIKAKVFSDIDKKHKESQLTENELSLEDALKKRLETTNLPYDSIYAPTTMHYKNLTELDDFLINLIGVNFQMIKDNKDVWNNGTPYIASKKIPGLHISIYDRVAQGISNSLTNGEMDVDISLSIRSEQHPRALRAAILDSFEEKKPKA